jgi:ornithine decarboxylase
MLTSARLFHRGLSHNVSKSYGVYFLKGNDPR